jgi:hypothetical protein
MVASNARSLSGANTGWNKFGHNDDVDTGADEDIWTGPALTWVPPTAARIHGIVSTDDVNDNIGGDGALTVLVQGLDTDFNEQEETVTMTGTTPANTQLAYTRINRMAVATAGVNGINGGAISAVAAVDATTTAHIPAGESQTQQAVFTVPNGAQMLLDRYYCNVNPGSPAGVIATVKLMVRENADQPGSPEVVKHINGVSDTAPLDFEFRNVKPSYNGKTDIVLRVGVSALNTLISGGFDLVFV